MGVELHCRDKRTQCNSGRASEDGPLGRLKADDYRRMRHIYIRLLRSVSGTRPRVVRVSLAEGHECGCHSYTCEKHGRAPT